MTSQIVPIVRSVKSFETDRAGFDLNTGGQPHRKHVS